ncbi:MAG: hypothetical protein Q9163_000548 [Psora crenata]
MSLIFALQALLARHEAYMAEAEEERRRMGITISRLIMDKKELEASNAKTIEENRYLLDQLEQLNNNVSDSDAQIRTLSATLESTRKEMDKMAALAAQTLQLETQLSMMEAEQARLLSEVVSKGEETQTAIQRWRSAERTVNALSEQVDRIEKEAREERARHTEVVARLERRRAVDRELEAAAGRLKGAAAATTMGDRKGSGNVVSNFVKDILQDNANLQMGIVELREMLSGSNEEVENLREQMMLHQPVLVGSEKDGEPFLNSELMKAPTSEVSNFHVHHHYHTAPKVDAKDKPQGLRRPKKKRYVTSPGLQAPISGLRTPQLQATPLSSAATILLQTSVTVPPPPQASALRFHRWSAQSLQDPSSTIHSSAPSSPQSTYQDQSLFDAGDDTLNSSRPTSPASTNLDTPDFQSPPFKRGSDIPINRLAVQSNPVAPPTISGVFQCESYGERAAFPILQQSTILEEAEISDSRPSTTDTDVDLDAEQDYKSFPRMRPRLQRASSAESILRTSGMDIPKLCSKRSRLLSSPHTSLGTSNASIEPVTSSASAVGKPSGATRHYDSSSYNRLLLANSSFSSSPSTAKSAVTTDKPTLGKKLGGWMTGKWGMTPTASFDNLRAKAALTSIDAKSAAAVKRAAGNNKAVNRHSAHVEAITINNALLEEALEGG